MKFFNTNFGMGWIRNVVDQRDWDFDSLQLPKPVYDEISLWPDVPEVLNQKSVGCCVAGATIGAASIVDRILGRAYVPLSILFAYYNARRLYSPTIRDSGTSIRNCIKGVQKFGCPDDKYWPFTTSVLKVNRRPGWEAYAMGLSRRDLEYYAIKSDRIASIKAAIASKTPVVFGTALTAAFKTLAYPYSVSRPPENEKIIGYHAMCVIGYRQQKDFCYFEVLNSWGPNWGDEGRVWMHEDYLTWGETSDPTALRKWNVNV